MKQKLSVTLEKETLQRLDLFLEDGSFRNKSHAVEFALRSLLREKK